MSVPYRFQTANGGVKQFFIRRRILINQVGRALKYGGIFNPVKPAFRDQWFYGFVDKVSRAAVFEYMPQANRAKANRQFR